MKKNSKNVVLLQINNEITILISDQAKYLEIIIDKKLNWKTNIEEISFSVIVISAKSGVLNQPRK